MFLASPAFAQNWTGAVDRNAGSAGNWNTNAVPNVRSNLLLNNGALANQPLLYADMEVNQLTIQAGEFSIYNGEFTARTKITLSGGTLGTGNFKIGTVGQAGTFVQTGGTVTGTVSAGVFEVEAGMFSGTMVGLASDTPSQRTTFVKSGNGTFTFNGGGQMHGADVAVEAGTLKFTGAASFGQEQAWTVAAGALVQYDAFSTQNFMGSLAGAGTIEANTNDKAALVVGDNNASTTWSGELRDGTAVLDVAKRGTGTLTLASANAYSGQTLVSEGSVVVRHNQALGTSGDVVVTTNGTLNLANVQIGNKRLYLEGTLLGSRIPWANANDMMTAFQVNRYDGNVVTIGSPRIQTDWDIVLGGNISGTGSLTKTGAGRLTISRSANHTGGTRIEAGTLQVGEGGPFLGSLSGNVVNLADLAFNRSDTTSFGGVISGTGMVRQIGSGALHLTGVNTYTGATHVEAGTIVVDGSIASSTTTLVNGNLYVNGRSGAVIVTRGYLGGSGTVGATTLNGGTLSAGSGIGKLNVDGTLAFGAGTSLLVDVASGGNTAGVHNDLVAATGAVTIDPTAMVKVRPANGSDNGKTYSPDTTYTVLSAAGLTGAFGGVTDDFAFLDSSLSYDARNVYVTLARNDVSFQSVATTSNQVGAAGALSSFAAGDPVSQALMGLSGDQAARAFELASGDSHSSGQSAAGQSLSLFQGAMGSAGASASGGVMSYMDAGPALTGPVGTAAIVDIPLYANAAWLSPMIGRGSIAGDGNGAPTDWTAAGLAVGYERRSELAGGEATAGIGVGYVLGSTKTPARLASSNSQGAQLGVYGNWSDDAVSLAANLDYGISRVNSERDIVVGALTSTASAEYWTQGFNAGVLGGYGFDMAPGLRVGPAAGVRLGWSGHKGFSETGAGGLNATIGATDTWKAESVLGLATKYEIGDLEVRGKALWLYNFADTATRSTVALAGGGAAYEVISPAIGRNRLEVGAGISWSVAHNITLSGDYSGQFFGGQSQHSGRAGVAVEF